MFIEVDYDFNGNQVKRVKAELLATDPTLALADAGRYWYNTTTNLLKYWNGTTVITIDEGANLTVKVDGVSDDMLSIVNDELIAVLATATNHGVMPKTDKAKLDNATSSPTASTLAERDASGRLQVVDGTAAQDVITVSQLQAATTNVKVLKGGIDCSSNPNYPVAEVGWTWQVTVAGKIGGASGVDVEIGDEIVCSTDNAGGTQAVVGADFYILQANIDPSIYAQAKGKTLDSVDSAIARVFSGGRTTFTFTHNLNHQYFACHVYLVSTGEKVGADILFTSANVIDIKFNGDKADGVYGLAYTA